MSDFNEVTEGLFSEDEIETITIEEQEAYYYEVADAHIEKVVLYLSQHGIPTDVILAVLEDTSQLLQEVIAEAGEQDAS